MSVHIPITTDVTTVIRNSIIDHQSTKRPSGKLSRQLHQPHVTLVEYKSIRFLITDQPNACTMENFITTCKLYKVRKLVRVCEPLYDKEMLEAAGIDVIDLEYNDGAAPPDSVLNIWFQLITDLWHESPESCVAVHCKAGLGRAPVLVAAALVELGLPYVEAVGMIRGLRSGALNACQLQYLEHFHPRKRLRNLKTQNDRCCLL